MWPRQRTSSSPSNDTYPPNNKQPRPVRLTPPPPSNNSPPGPFQHRLRRARPGNAGKSMRCVGVCCVKRRARWIESGKSSNGFLCTMYYLRFSGPQHSGCVSTPPHRRLPSVYLPADSKPPIRARPPKISHRPSGTGRGPGAGQGNLRMCRGNVGMRYVTHTQWAVVLRWCRDMVRREDRERGREGDRWMGVLCVLSVAGLGAGLRCGGHGSGSGPGRRGGACARKVRISR